MSKITESLTLTVAAGDVEQSYTLRCAAKGDVDCDGAVTVADVSILRRYKAGWPGYDAKVRSMNAADIDGDGSITVADVTALARYKAGWGGKYDAYFE
jgi:hypothetical protein